MAGQSFIFEAGNTFVTGENHGQFCQDSDAGAVRRLTQSGVDRFFLDESGIFRKQENAYICAFSQIGKKVLKGLGQLQVDVTGKLWVTGKKAEFR